MRTAPILAAGAILAAAIFDAAPVYAQGPPIISGYKSMFAANGRMRNGAHPAIDFGGSIGDPVLAAADGRVIYAAESPLCGNGIRIWHQKFDRYTLYCHLRRIDVRSGDEVKRGQVIGALGDTGEPTLRAMGMITLPQLHFELASTPHARNDGQTDGTFDPLAFTVGCFDPAHSYPTDRLALTYPLRCRN